MFYRNPGIEAETPDSFNHSVLSLPENREVNNFWPKKKKVFFRFLCFLRWENHKTARIIGDLVRYRCPFGWQEYHKGKFWPNKQVINPFEYPPYLQRYEAPFCKANFFAPFSEIQNETGRQRPT